MKYEHIFERLREIRERDLERSREWVAVRMAIDMTTLRDWEMGKRMLNLEKLSEWAEVMGYEMTINLEKRNEKT